MPATKYRTGRPPVGPVKRVRYEPDFLEWAQQYADEHCSGNLNRALRELGKIAREQVEKQRQRGRRSESNAA